MDSTHPATLVPKKILTEVSTRYPLSREKIDSFVVEIVETLQKAGFQAYIVGGGVRDLLMGFCPKDFDVVTDAHPEKIRDLFPNSRLIGHRFRLAHVFNRQHVVEVATFRGGHGKTQDESVAHTREGIIVRDNVYGTFEEDAFRRDFTINALYYDPISDHLIDWTDGLLDLERKILRVIGDPRARFHEDPVRILRAIRISNKLCFDIDPLALAEFCSFADRVQFISSGRLFDEYTKLFLLGEAEANFASLKMHHLFGHLFPFTDSHLDAPIFHELVQQTLVDTDKRVVGQQGVNPAFLLAIFLWPVFLKNCQKLPGSPEAFSAEEALDPGFEDESSPNGLPSQQPGALHGVISFTVSQQARYLAMPRRFTAAIRQIWAMQILFEQKNPERVLSVVSHFRFRAAYDFLLLRARCGDAESSLAAWWTSFYQADETEKEEFIEVLRLAQPIQRQKPRRSRNRP